MKKNLILMTVVCFCLLSAVGCSGTEPSSVSESETTYETSSGTSAETAAVASESGAAENANDKIASPDEMVTPETIVEEGMVPVYADSLREGTYSVTVDSSSSMFSITVCTLTVADGKMTAEMTMSGKGYLYVFMGKGEEAVCADESAYIPFAETTEGAHTFTVPVEALDMGIDCTAFSRKKEKWYDRTLLFRADSLPADAFSSDAFHTVESLGLADGEYSIDVTLKGGSGRASVASPAKLTVAGGKAFAVVEWSSANYDYMIVNDEKFLPVNTEGNSTFEIPVERFGFSIPVKADTTAMSTPHEIGYTLLFDAETLTQK